MGCLKITAEMWRQAFLKGLYREDSKFAIQGVISNIRNEFESLKGFLGDAEERQEDDELVKEWMSAIEDLVTEAHELTEKHLDRIARHRQIKPGFWNALKAYPRAANDGAIIAREASKINHLSNRISGMTAKMKAYGIEERRVESIADQGIETICLSNIDIKTSMVVGLEKDIEMIEDQLICTGRRRRGSVKVIGIYGVNGLGKTTLAKEVFDSKKIVDHFDARTWAFVGQEDDEFSLRDVFKSMIRDLDGTIDLSELTENELSENLRRILTEKRCLVVLDDLKRTATWDLLKTALLSESSSKLVVTACDPALLSCIDSHKFLHQHRFLNFKERWELFLKEIGSSGKGSRDSKKRRTWKPLIQHCTGLPLTILVLGGLFKNSSRTPLLCSPINPRHNTYRLDECNDDVQSKLELEVELVLRSSLANLRFRRLPYLCLLETTHFPAGREIPTEELFTNWIESERDIFKYMRPSTARRFAQKCLDELVNRSLIQVVTEENGKVKYCQLHSLIRDFSIRVKECPSIIDISIYDGYKIGLGAPIEGLGLVSL